MAEVYALAEDPADSALYAGGAAGVYESLDGGATWHPAAEGLTNPFVLSLEVLPNGTFLAGTRAGSIFRRSDTSAVPRDPVERSAGRDETRELPFRSENSSGMAAQIAARVRSELVVKVLDGRNVHGTYGFCIGPRRRSATLF